MIENGGDHRVGGLGRRKSPYPGAERGKGDGRDAVLLGQLQGGLRGGADLGRVRLEVRAEGAGRSRSVLEGVPRSLPSLLRAQRVQSKAARIGFDWPDAAAAWQKVREELGEVEAALARGERARIQEELGDVFFSVVNVARLCEIDAEEALQGAVEKFRRRFTQMEADLTARGKDTASATPEELERLWQAVKAREHGGGESPR